MPNPPVPRRLLASALFVLPLLLSAATVEERLQELESKVSTLSTENTVLRRQLGVDSAKASAAFLTAQGKEKSLAIGGYLQFQGEFGDAPDSRFPAEDRLLIRRARLGVKGSFVEDVDFVMQAEFGSGKLGPTAGYSAQLTDVYVVWNKFDQANVTLGQFKTPYGYEQLLSDTKLPLVERSLPSDKLTLSRQIGAMLSGDFFDKRLHYSAGLFNGTGTNTNTNDNDSFTYVGRVNGVIVDRSKLKLTAGTNVFQSHDTAPAPGFTGSRHGLGFDVQAVSGPLTLGAEWLQTSSDPDAGAKSTAEGWSALAGYQIIPKKLQAVVRYETFDPKDTVTGDESDVWTIGFNYYLKGEDLKLSLNYLLGDPAGPLSDQGRLLARVQVIF
jgi:phosphate-selective porin OprO and OprP